MAENIYSKGTRVWFEDKDQAWISAEVTAVTKGADDSIKLVFVDERGKVRVKISPVQFTEFTNMGCNVNDRNLSLIPLARISRPERKACLLFEILPCWKRQMI
jgi:hypothetical protein